MNKQVIVYALLSTMACSPTAEQKAHVCEQLSHDVALPTKLTTDGTDCMIQCPAPVGWIQTWMWADRHGCGVVQ